MRRAWSAALLAALIFDVGVAAAQTAKGLYGQAQASVAKSNAFRQGVAGFLARRSQLQQQAKMAFNREMARKKAGDCLNARSTYEEVMCLSKAVDATAANYRSFTGALRALLGQKNPLLTNEEDAVSGATGKPLTSQEMLKEFDQVETEWEKYRKDQCAAAYDLFKGGTIAPVMAGECQLDLMRSRMAGLNSIYDMTLHH